MSRGNIPLICFLALVRHRLMRQTFACRLT